MPLPISLVVPHVFVGLFFFHMCVSSCRHLLSSQTLSCFYPTYIVSISLLKKSFLSGTALKCHTLCMQMSKVEADPRIIEQDSKQGVRVATSWTPKWPFRPGLKRLQMTPLTRGLRKRCLMIPKPCHRTRPWNWISLKSLARLDFPSWLKCLELEGEKEDAPGTTNDDGLGRHHHQA